MTWIRQIVVVTLLASTALAAQHPAPAKAEAPAMANLRVEGDEDAWHAEEVFRLDWDQVPGPPVTPSAVVYRLYDEAGKQLGPEVAVTDDVQKLGRVRVPSTPGVYTSKPGCATPAERQARPRPRSCASTTPRRCRRVWRRRGAGCWEPSRRC